MKVFLAYVALGGTPKLIFYESLGCLERKVRANFELTEIFRWDWGLMYPQLPPIHGPFVGNIARRRHIDNEDSEIEFKTCSTNLERSGNSTEPPGTIRIGFGLTGDDDNPISLGAESNGKRIDHHKNESFPAIVLRHSVVTTDFDDRASSVRLLTAIHALRRPIIDQSHDGLKSLKGPGPPTSGEPPGTIRIKCWLTGDDDNPLSLGARFNGKRIDHHKDESFPAIVLRHSVVTSDLDDRARCVRLLSAMHALRRPFTNQSHDVPKPVKGPGPLTGGGSPPGIKTDLPIFSGNNLTRKMQSNNAPVRDSAEDVEPQLTTMSAASRVTHKIAAVIFVTVGVAAALLALAAYSTVSRQEAEEALIAQEHRQAWQHLNKIDHDRLFGLTSGNGLIAE